MNCTCIKSSARTGLGQRLFAWGMSKESYPSKYLDVVTPHKRALFADLHGDVLEIGPGTGANFGYYPADIHWIGAEPNVYMHPYLKAAAEKHGFQADIRSMVSEHLEIDDCSVDGVVSTLVLCSVSDQSRTLAEILRVLRPGGRYVFIEHVAAPPQTRLRQAQRWLRPIFTTLGDGCHPDRETWVAIQNAGFESANYQSFTVPMPIWGPHIAGVAIKAR